MTMKTKKYAIYARASGDVEKQSRSIKSQVKTLQMLAKSNSLDITQIYEEVGSASAEDRPCFESMVRNIKTGQINGILCIGIDRLARTFDCSLDACALILRKKVEIITPALSVTNSNEAVVSLFISALTQKNSVEQSELIKRGLILKGKNAITLVRVSSGIQKNEEGGE